VRGWVGWVALAIACGPRVSPSGEGATESGSGTDGSGTTVTSSSGGSATESTSEVTTTTSNLPSSSGVAESESSGSSSTGGEPEVIEIEGLIEVALGDGFLLRTCDGSLYTLGGDTEDLWRCSGAYAHLRGTVLECPGGCSKSVVSIDEVLEARLCEPTDCGGTSCAALACADECEQDGQCSEGAKCVPWAPAGMPYAGRRCVEIAGDPVGVGEACREDPTMPWVDDCEASSMCTGVDPKTSTGTCTRICQHDDECADDERCVVSNAQDFNACLRVCNPLDETCPIGSMCVALDQGIGCVDEDELPFLAEVPCEGGLACEGASVCAEASSLPGCARDTCCAPLCDMLAPSCPPDTACVALYENPPAGLENLGVCRS
jgi:hypothetical protein